jgi:imidazole glycerol-phosphate synthase subunit HisF
MFRPRIIPVLLLQNQELVKSKQFKKHRYIGDPINAIKIFNDLRADEVVLLDIDATKENRVISLDFVRILGEETNMPFSVGGGIRSLDQIQNILSSGAEKVIINSYAVENPDFIKTASNYFGSSTIVVCIDVKNNFFGTSRVWTHNGKKSSRYSPIDFAKLMEEMGAGEIIIQSILCDGMMSGYDLDLIKEISTTLTIPVVALGGAGKLDHLMDAYYKGSANALAAGSLFVYQGPRNGVLINYPDKSDFNFTE